MSAQASAVITSTTPLWYATRATGVISIVLLTATLVLGITVQSRAESENWSRLAVAGIHRNLSLLVCLFLLLHIVTAEADTFAPVGWWAVAVPFVSAYRPLWLGLGTVAADLLVALVVSSLWRTHISLQVWKAIHWTAYACWPLAIVHGLGTGTDARSLPIEVVTFVCVATVLSAVVQRLASDWRSHLAIRVGAATTGLAATVVGALWALTGPLQPGWSAKADTPVHPGEASTAAGSAGLELPVNVSVSGTARTSAAGDGQETVTLTGTGGSDAFTVQLVGPPAAR